MKLSLDKKEKYSILTLKEENVNASIAPNLKSEFAVMKNAGTPYLILDMQHVDFIDSSGLSAFLTAHRLWKNEGAFVLCNIKSDHVSKILNISKLDSVLTIVPTMQEAEDFILMEEVQKELSEEE